MKGAVSDDFYTEIYNSGTGSDHRKIEFADLLDRIENIVHLNNNSKVLDIGCGSGILGEQIINKFGAKVHGIDLNDVATKKASALGIKTVKADLESKWPYKNSTFDAVFGMEILEHLVNPDVVLQEAKRVLKPNGYLILTTPNLAAWFNRILLPLGFQPFLTEVSTIDKTLGLEFTRKLTPHRTPVGHLRVFTHKALRGILKLHKFEIIYTAGIDPYYLPEYMKPFDRIFSKIPSLSADILVVATIKDF